MIGAVDVALAVLAAIVIGALLRPMARGQPERPGEEKSAAQAHAGPWFEMTRVPAGKCVCARLRKHVETFSTWN